MCLNTFERQVTSPSAKTEKETDAGVVVQTPLKEATT